MPEKTFRLRHRMYILTAQWTGSIVLLQLASVHWQDKEAIFCDHDTRTFRATGPVDLLPGRVGQGLYLEAHARIRPSLLLQQHSVLGERQVSCDSNDSCEWCTKKPVAFEASGRWSACLRPSKPHRLYVHVESRGASTIAELEPEVVRPRGIGPGRACLHG